MRSSASVLSFSLRLQAWLEVVFGWKLNHALDSHLGKYRSGLWGKGGFFQVFFQILINFHNAKGEATRENEVEKEANINTACDQGCLWGGPPA
jgi:hypothetical protein